MSTAVHDVDPATRRPLMLSPEDGAGVDGIDTMQEQAASSKVLARLVGKVIGVAVLVVCLVCAITATSKHKLLQSGHLGPEKSKSTELFSLDQCLFWKSSERKQKQLWLPGKEFTSKPKVFWFGTDVDLTDDTTLALMARHAAAGYGWQQGWNFSLTPPPEQNKPWPYASWALGRGDEFQSEAVAHLRSYMDRVGNNETMLITYRQIQVALRLYAQSEAAADNDNPHWWLHNGTTKCLAPQPWGTKDPLWNFSVQEAADWWVDKFIFQITNDTALQGGRAAVFFDELDQQNCGYDYKQAGCHLTKDDILQLQVGTNKMLPRMVKRLNDAGIVPILSSDNLLSHATHGLPGPPSHCALTQDTVMEALKGLQWVRFYEVWPWTNWVLDKWGHSAELYAANIANAILEAEAGIPTILHSGWFDQSRMAPQTNPECPAPDRNITRPGWLGGDVQFFIAAYLIVQSPGTMLSFSSDWRSKDFCWRPEFDVEYGTPLGPATRTGPYSWTRNYTKADVQVDVSQQYHGYTFECQYCGWVHLHAEDGVQSTDE